MKNPTKEQQRLEAQRRGQEDWQLWGPYLSERAWGTVREDYSTEGEAWTYFSHEHARARAYRWNEDGLGGICDSGQRLCLALGLWNGHDPILKERLFGLTSDQGNHGEDVKECFFYQDATPSHSLNSGHSIFYSQRKTFITEISENQSHKVRLKSFSYLVFLAGRNSMGWSCLTVYMTGVWSKSSFSTFFRLACRPPVKAFFLGGSVMYPSR